MSDNIAQLRHNINARRRQLKATPYLVVGQGPFRLSMAEQTVFGFETDEFVFVAPVFQAFEILIDGCSEGEDDASLVDEDLAESVMNELDWLKMGQYSDDDFVRFAKLFDVGMTAAKKMSDKIDYWRYRNGAYSLGDD